MSAVLRRPLPVHLRSVHAPAVPVPSEVHVGLVVHALSAQRVAVVRVVGQRIPAGPSERWPGLTFFDPDHAPQGCPCLLLPLNHPCLPSGPAVGRDEPMPHVTPWHYTT